MTSPVLFILIPGATGLGLYFLRRWFRFSVIAGFSMAVLLAVLAWFLPIGVQVNLGAWSFKIADSLEILGRRLVLDGQDRILLWMVYFAAAFFFAAVYIAQAGRTTVPLGLMMVAFWIAAMAVEPLIYGALLMELAVLVSIPIFIQPGLPGIRVDRALVRGGLRLLTLQTMGMALLLLTGWTLTGVETIPNQETVTRAASLLVFGMALILGVFPFHTWITILTEKTHPYAASIVLVNLLWMGLLLSLRFLDRYPWLNQVGVVVVFLRMAGIFMIAVGGGSAAFERHLGRILGYAFLMESGFMLFAASYAASQPIIMVSMLPRVVSFGVLALTLSVIQSRTQALDLSRLRGLGNRMPLLSGALALALLSVTGLPLLAYFPLRLMLWDTVATLPAWAVWSTSLGPIGLLAASMRVVLSLVSSGEGFAEDVRENWQTVMLAGIAILFLFIVGLFPHWFSGIFIQGMQAFGNLAP